MTANRDLLDSSKADLKATETAILKLNQQHDDVIESLTTLTQQTVKLKLVIHTLLLKDPTATVLTSLQNTLNQYSETRDSYRSALETIDAQIHTLNTTLTENIASVVSTLRELSADTGRATRAADERNQIVAKHLQNTVLTVLDDFKNVAPAEYAKFEKRFATQHESAQFNWLFTDKSHHSAEWKTQQVVAYINLVFKELYQTLGTHPLVKALQVAIEQDPWQCLKQTSLTGAKNVTLMLDNVQVRPSSPPVNTEAMTTTNQQRMEAIQADVKQLERQILDFVSHGEAMKAAHRNTIAAAWQTYTEQRETPLITLREQLQQLKALGKTILLQLDNGELADTFKTQIKTTVNAQTKVIDKHLQPLETLLDKPIAAGLTITQLTSSIEAGYAIDSAALETAITAIQSKLTQLGTRVTQEAALPTTLLTTLQTNLTAPLTDKDKIQEINTLFANATGTDLEKLQTVLDNLASRKSPHAMRFHATEKGPTIKATTHAVLNAMNGSNKSLGDVVAALKDKVKNPETRGTLLENLQQYAEGQKPLRAGKRRTE